MKTFAISEDYGDKYVTRGKEYVVIEFKDVDRYAFNIVLDNGFKAFCLVKGCAHLDGGDWTLIEKEDDSND